MRHLQKSGIITLKALGGPIGSRTAQVQEAYEVHYSDGIRAAKKFSNEKQAIQFAKDLIKSKKGLQYVDVFNAGSGFHSTADTDAIVAWWGKGSYTDNKSKHDSKLASKKINESINEGKKAFKVNPGIGSSKYSISSHDGVKKHKDGSDFYDIQIFKNKVDLEKGIKDYKSKGFVEESQRNQDFKFENVNEAKVIDIIDRFEHLKLPDIVYLNKKPYTGKTFVMNGYNGYTSSDTDGWVYDSNTRKPLTDKQGNILRATTHRGAKWDFKNGIRESVNESIENVANGLPQTMGKQKSLKREALKSIVKEVMQEEAEYQKFFQKVLDKAGKSIPSMSDDEKKAFFNKVDAAWKGKQEGK